MLYSYKMTNDSGFAPNPFHGIMTLANCKPLIRRKKGKGDTIAGFTSNRLCREKVGEERLIYIMEVTEKLSYEQYFNDERFECKIPSDHSLIAKTGDNIYQPLVTGFRQLKNWSHENKHMNHDLKGEFVLLSTEFFYFGSGAIPVDSFKIQRPRFQSAHGVKTDNETEITRLWDYLKANYQQNIALHQPHSWKKYEPFNQ